MLTKFLKLFHYIPSSIRRETEKPKYVLNETPKLCKPAKIRARMLIRDQ